MADPMQQARELSSPDEIAFRLRNLAQNMAAGSGPVARDHQAWKRVEELAEAVAALRAAPEWQPMETAPHTGVAVLLWQPWKSGRDCAVIGHYANGWCWRDNEEMQPEPTHWMPLPASPLAARPQGVKDAR